MAHLYVRLDPFLPEHKADAVKGEDYPDGAGFAFVLTLCWAARQTPPGHFHSKALLVALLGKRGRWVPFLVDHGDVVTEEGGSLYVPGWSEWQEGHYPTIGGRRDAIDARPKTGAERQKAFRERAKVREAAADASRAAVSSPDVTAAPGPHVTGNGNAALELSVGIAIASLGSTGALDPGPRESLTGDGSSDRTNERPRRRARPPADEEAIASHRAVLADPSSPAWLRDEAEKQLGFLGIHPSGGAATS